MCLEHARYIFHLGPELSIIAQQITSKLCDLK